VIGNIFSLFLVIVDIADICITLVVGISTSTAAPENALGKYTAVLRIVRFLRLARLFRLLNAPAFRDMLAIVRGLGSGMSTLAWSLLFFGCFNYVMALMFRSVFGPESTYFNSVPMSMLTSFRCTFLGDCSLLEQNPLTSVVMVGFIFFTTVGLLNLISAIFVDSIMNHSQEERVKAQKERLHETGRFNQSCRRFLRVLLNLQTTGMSSRCLDTMSEECSTTASKPDAAFNWRRTSRRSEQEQRKHSSFSLAEQNTLRNNPFRKDLLDRVVRSNSPLVANILEDLDIEPVDCLSLSDTLDADGDGFIKVHELIQGLRRLQGPARRSDIVTVDLRIRRMQKHLDKVLAKLCSNFDRVT